MQKKLSIAACKQKKMWHIAIIEGRAMYETDNAIDGHFHLGYFETVCSDLPSAQRLYEATNQMVSLAAQQATDQ